MPTTVNGVGTRYYGQKNLKTATSTCDNCGHRGALKSYETTLWFVVFFVPLIPLGRKQVIDYCPKCTHPRAGAAGEWQEIRATVTEESVRRMKEDADNPETAMQMLANLEQLNDVDEGAKLAGFMATKFAQDAETQLFLGSFYERHGRDREAKARYAAALRVAPANLAARRAVGIAALAEGNLERAQELLSFMREPGPEQDSDVLYLLGRALHGAGQHEGAMEIFKVLCRDYPAVVKNQRTVRQTISACEQALGWPPQILPKISVTKRLTYAFAIGLVASLAFTVLFAVIVHLEDPDAEVFLPLGVFFMISTPLLTLLLFVDQFRENPTIQF